jgi:hypothetical protein
MSHLRLISRFGRPALSTGLLVAVLGVGPARPVQAAVREGAKGPQLLIGRGDDNIDSVGTQDGAAGLDAIVFGATDREAVPDLTTGVRLPTLLVGVNGFPQGLPTADVSGLPQHCTIERSPLPGYDAFADLTLPTPAFVDVSRQQVENLNRWSRR